MQTARITHLADDSGETEKVVMLDGHPREVVRHDDLVEAYLPEGRLLVVEKRAGRRLFPGLLKGPVDAVDANYRVELTSQARIAGRTCDVIQLLPRDNLRYGYRLCADRQTGLLLKIETLDEQRDSVEQVSFTDVEIGGHPTRASLRPSVPSVEGWNIEHRDSEPADVSQQPWKLDADVGGFHPVTAVHRVFASGRDVVQLVLSDGMASVSIFVEPIRPDAAPRSEGEARKGPINFISRALGQFWLTVVGEVPVQTIRQIAASVGLRETPK